MALVIETYLEVFNQLERDLSRCNAMNKYVNIHINTHTMEISHSIIPEEVVISGQYLIVSHGNFIMQLNFEEVNDFYIYYIKEDNSYYIRFDEIELYFDFI